MTSQDASGETEFAIAMIDIVKEFKMFEEEMTELRGQGKKKL